ncbi:hypothetical protein [Streptomyces sp. NPDC056844]|uniref:hypothetical protein n=1 Tax=unclassified Streptomyces TaxID=2593676 RepID=UPI0036C82087
MRMRAMTAAVTAVLAVILVGCGNNSEPEKARATANETAPPDGTPTGQPVSEESAARADAKTPSVVAMGAVQKFSFAGDEEYDPNAGTVTVLSYQQPVSASVTAAEEVGTKGYVWAALEVKVCATEGDITTSSQPWTLAYDDGARIQPISSTYEDFPKPHYVEDAAVSAGDCSRGKIVFPVPGEGRPSKAVYATDSYPALRWSLKK